MIFLTQTETELVGINELFTAGCFDNTMPEPHNQIGVRVVYEDLSSDNKLIYDAFWNLFTDKPLVEVLNAPCKINIDRMVTQTIIEEGLYTINFDDLSQDDKNKVLDFNQMITALAEEETN